ncbi:hypothetical protein IQ256_10710 [cf. Phormidesmis sp. LEGE 11477]|nr:hypothetical protein [cf. Phormidesmis sp. LEGE 11477]MBE9061442.1 hypothetical protein [cf. Phormidesmis sp. LEGE 11477]
MGLGYMLSPLSWWNDLFFNLPIALIIGYGVGWINPQWFMPGTVVGYWLSNVLGMVMMQFGAVDIFLPEAKQNMTRDMLLGFGGATLYTVIVAVLIFYHVVDIPDFLTDLQ